MKTCPTCGREYEGTNTLCPVDGAVLKKSGKDALIGEVLAGKYRIEEKIDEGGMGCVYRATHILMEKTIAVKVLHPALAADDNIVERFTREAKAASRISHPHAITVTDFGESENGVVYLVMEYLRGRTLKDIVRSDGPLPLTRVIEIVRQVAGALEAAHTEGVVHRDLKSDNIMLEETAAGGDWAKVLDFGIAKIQQDVDKNDPGLTAPNLIIGTPQYMSPEQCSQASNIDSRSDIYSFGIILYEMLVGHVPFTGDSPTTIMMKQLQEPAPSILDERKDLPASVGEVVARALAKQPEDRFQHANELSDALAATAAEASETESVPALNTDRIVIPTSSNEAPRTTFGDDADEATVVSSGYARPTTDELPPPVAPLPPPQTSFNPWSIAIPAVAALVILFAVVYAVQRRGGSSEQQPQLQSDPNSQPVQSITPPNGQAESNLAPSAAPTPNVIVVGAPPNSNAVETPLPEQGVENTNQQPTQETGNKENSNTPRATPTPTPRGKQIPDINVNIDSPPPPPPAPVKKEQPKPEVTPDSPSLSGDAPPSRIESRKR